MPRAKRPSEPSQFQGKHPPRKGRSRRTEGAGYPEPGTMRPAAPPASDGTERPREDGAEGDPLPPDGR